ncbi:CheR family methyltransferase [Deinococcus altitudinis]|uniref:CheR family methyltransferase n=1 Tax=Deinococcus altitudinis TaxID=468914 RepID=UPI003891A432
MTEGLTEFTEGASERSVPLGLPGPPKDPPIRVVGIGGSAGALDGYERLFLGIPPVNGMAFVVVSHLDPGHKGLMPDILARCTSMPVVQIEEGMSVLADRVHVIPPGSSLGMSNGKLHLRPLTEDHRLVIDGFFDSLALDQREQAVAIVLSGMGSDGTRGLRAIKKWGGQVLVENPATAEYPSMPSSAVATGLADDVLPVEDLAVRLMGLTEHTRLLDAQELTGNGGESGAPLQQILRLVQSRSGHDFTRYKRNTLVRRIDRRMQGQRIQDVAQYIQLLEESASEAEALFQDFTINVTSFFRDAEAFESLKIHLRGYLQHREQNKEPFRVWVAACSTGEEAYSVAIVLHELLEELGGDSAIKMQIFATDIDQEAVGKARLGRYSRDIAYVVSAERLSRYFFLKDDHYQVRADLRESVIFAAHSTFGDPPFTRLDLLCCRNMLIYVGTELQKRILELFMYALRPGGLLFLGASETVGTEREQFTALNPRWKIFQRGEGTPGLPPLGQAFRAGGTGLRPGDTDPRMVGLTGAHHADLAGQVLHTLLADYAPPAVVIGEEGEVLYVHGRTARFLEYPPGRMMNNVFEMVPANMRYELRSAVRQCRNERREISRRGFQIETDGGSRLVDLTVKPLLLQNAVSQGSRPIMIVFQERPAVSVSATETAAEAGQVRALELELRYGREALQATVEEMAVSMEEIRSSNEELQSTNEELQSTNEELMTSKEELQSLNEELNTVNTEHQLIIHDQAQANDDTRNLLENAGTATVFLNNELKIKRFTPLISRIVRLTPSDEGRALTDFSVMLRYEHLTENIQQVLRTLEPFETQVQTTDGAWYLLRISPYRTFDNLIDGVVVAFTDIGVIKELEWRLVKSLTQAESLTESLQDPLQILDQHLRAVVASRELLHLLSTARPHNVGQRPEEGADLVSSLPGLQQRLQDVIAGEEPLSSSLRDLSASQRRIRRMKVEAELLVVDDGNSELVRLKLDDLPV